MNLTSEWYVLQLRHWRLVQVYTTISNDDGMDIV